MDIVKKFRLFKYPLVKEVMQHIMRKYPELAYSVTYFISNIEVKEEETEGPIAFVSLTKEKDFNVHIGKNKTFERCAECLGNPRDLMEFVIFHELFHILFFHIIRKDKILKIYRNINEEFYNYLADETVNELIFFSFPHFNKEKTRRIFVDRETILFILKSLLYRYGCVDVKKYRELWEEYRELDVYATLGKRCFIVNQMLDLLKIGSKDDINISEVLSSSEKNEKGEVSGDKKEKGKKDSRPSEKDPFSSFRIEKGDSIRMDVHKYPSEEGVDEHEREEIEKKITYLTWEMRDRSANLELWERIVEMQRSSQEIIENVIKKISRIRSIKGIIARIISVSLYTKEIPSKEIINKRNLTVNEEYAYLTRPFKRETLLAELNFFVDISGSINEWMLSTIMSSIKEIFFIYSLKMNVYVWSSHPNDPIYVTTLSPQDSVHEIVRSIKKMEKLESGMGTTISPVMKFIDNRDDFNKMVNVIYTDGYVEIEEELYRIERVKEKNIVFIVENDELSSPFERVYPNSQIVYI